VNAGEVQIRQVIQRWHQATAAGDLKTVLTLMTDDVVFLTAGQPPMNKDAFAAAFRKFSGRARIESTQDIKEIHASGDLAYCWSHISVVMTSLETGVRNRRAGHVLSVFRKQPGHGWLLARDANLLGT
jgi:uncharacterized protein (TIGR02246 family)